MSAKDFDQSLGEYEVLPGFFQVQVSAIYHMSATSGAWLFSTSRFLL
jgi:hypothetical protein